MYDNKKCQGLRRNLLQVERSVTYCSNQLLALHHVHNLQSDVLPTASLRLLRAGSQVRTADHVRVVDQWTVLRRLLWQKHDHKVRWRNPFINIKE